MRKIVETRSSLSNTIKVLAQSCVTPPYIIQKKGLRMIVLVSLIVLLRELLVSTIFRMVHPYIAIQNDFYTCIYTHVETTSFPAYTFPHRKWNVSRTQCMCIHVHNA